MPRSDESLQAEAGLASPGSWIDQLQEVAERFPAGPWAAYGALAVALAATMHVLHWAAGAIAFPHISIPVAFTSAFTPPGLASVHYGDRIAIRSLSRFQPAMQAPREEYARAQGRLTLLPGYSAPLGLALGAAMLWGVLRADPTFLGLLTGRLLTDLPLLILGWINSSTILVNLYYLVRQLSAVSAMHKTAGNINLYDWQPMFAFSDLTYRTTVLSVALVTLFVAVFPQLLGNPVGGLVVLLTLFLTGRCSSFRWQDCTQSCRPRSTGCSAKPAAESRPAWRSCTARSRPARSPACSA